MVESGRNSDFQEPLISRPQAEATRSGAEQLPSMMLSGVESSPFTLLQALISNSVKGMAVPGLIITLRNIAMPLTFITLAISIYEVLRFSLAFGPLPVGDAYVLVWVLLCLFGSIIGCVGTFTLHKGALLAASLIFCCAMAPVTPNMIVLTQGD